MSCKNTLIFHIHVLISLLDARFTSHLANRPSSIPAWPTWWLLLASKPERGSNHAEKYEGNTPEQVQVTVFQDMLPENMEYLLCSAFGVFSPSPSIESVGRFTRRPGRLVNRSEHTY